MNKEKNVVLVTGCSGLLGTRITQKLSDDYTVIGLDIQKPEGKQEQADYYYMDIDNDFSVENALGHIKEKYGKKVASVIHLAAYYSFGEQDWELYQKITTEGTKRLLNALRKFEVEQFIFASTQLVYKPQPPGTKVREDSPLKPDWEYPESKVITEKTLLEKNRDIPILILRITGIYDDFGHSIPLSHQIQRVYEDQFQKHLFPGNQKHGAPFLHREDFVEALYQAVSKRKELPHEEVLLLGEPNTYSYGEVQQKLGELLLNRKFNTYRVPKWFAKTGAWIQNHLPFYPKPFTKPWMIDISDDHYELDISHSKELLDWEPEHDLMESLPKMAEALKEDPEKWYEEHNLKNGKPQP